MTDNNKPKGEPKSWGGALARHYWKPLQVVVVPENGRFAVCNASDEDWPLLQWCDTRADACEWIRDNGHTEVDRG